MLFIDRQLLRESKGASPWDDGYLVNRIGPGQHSGDERVTRFMVGRVSLFRIADHHAFPLDAHHDLVLGILEIAHVHLLLVEPGGIESRFVDKVFDVGARKTRRAAGDHREIDVFGKGGLPGVDLQDLLTTLHIGQRHDDLTVETTGPQQGRIEDVGPVRGRYQDYPFVRFKTIHLDEELIQGLLPLVVSASQTCAAVTSDGVDFIDEDDAGGVLLALGEEIPHTRRPDADEHLDEIGSADAQKGDIRLTGDRPGQ